MRIDGLRSPYEKVERLTHFGRMLDKIRLHVVGKLPAEYQPFLGGARPHSFNARCCRFLRIDYAALSTQANEGGTDEGLFQWACTQGHKPSDEEIEIWNAYRSKRSWRDPYIPRLHSRLQEMRLPIGSALTMFDLIDLDEGRPLRFC